MLFAWVPFCAESIDSAVALWRGMLGFNGLSLPARLQGYLGAAIPGFRYDGLLEDVLRYPTQGVVWIAAGLVIVWAFPNSQQWLARFGPAWEPVEPPPRVVWRFSRRTGFVTGALVGVALVGVMSATSEFLYYQF